MPFLDSLAKCERFPVIAGAGNAFEGWLKWEFVAFLCKHWPWLCQSGRINPELIGVESRVLLVDLVDQDKRDKFVDVWFRAADADGARYHYLEMKVIFDNINLGKQAASAGSDLWYLASIHPDEEPASIGTLALFAGHQSTGRERVDVVRSRIEDELSPITYERTEPVKLGDHCWALYYETTWEAAHAELKQTKST